jgi:hypothetical protein
MYWMVKLLSLTSLTLSILAAKSIPPTELSGTEAEGPASPASPSVLNPSSVTIPVAIV